MTYIVKHSFWLLGINKVVREERRDILGGRCGDPGERIWGLDRMVVVDKWISGQFLTISDDRDYRT